MDKLTIIKQLEVVKSRIQREQWDIAESVLTETIKYIMHSSPGDEDEILRDHFAGQALQGLSPSELPAGFLAEKAYDVAEAMLAERKKVKDNCTSRRENGLPGSTDKIDRTRSEHVDISQAAKNESF